ncbi:Pescadillo [Wickerhamiella sorbophila]|uniref:Pescadillo homolog n=1 Tax=Wickerhamiella sorbophila TaxID=45607 RepID=A0A2T0FH84_9ASCO|nr:Pescadillo [Wickerhamiella sorbophila]PRT54299.1 Pescadillo [Wickerhamiella sorbophila]
MVKTNTKKEKRGGFLSRTQAVRALQVSLGDFRRLCILKGVYPRDVSGKAKKKLTKGSTKPITAYYRKDIQYLQHEPLLAKFREHKIFAKKLSRALGRGDVTDAQRLDVNRPRYTLDHIIKERYPTFVDALGDLDDALSMLFLFAIMPATDKVSYRITQEAERLSTEWMAFIAREGLLRKVFVSIKGVYYQANVRGQDIMWLVPFKFPQNVPSDIDFRIMLTFLEFYTTLLHFILYRLYTDQNLVYPPHINKSRASGVGGLSSFILESTDSGRALPDVETSGKTQVQKVKIALDKVKKADAEADDEDDAEEDAETEEFDTFEAGAEDGDSLVQPKARGNSDLFSKFTFYVGREVPLDIIEFLGAAFGARIISESALDEMVDNEDEEQSNTVDVSEVDLSKVTHQICDRPAVANKVPGRVYVQPQWIFDSVNKGELLPVGPYAPGETLPPHLSPWGDRGTYNPETAADDEVDSEVEEEEEDSEVEDEDEDDGEKDDEQQELQLEAAGVKYSDAPSKPKKRSAKVSKEDEEKELRKMMMTSKQKKLYGRMQHGNDKKQAREDKLRSKRRKLEKLKEKLA